MKKIKAIILQTCVSLFCATQAIAMAETFEEKDVLDLSRIYNENFSYSLPKPVLEGFFLGKAFDNMEEYSVDEKIKLDQDMVHIWKETFKKELLAAPVAIMTAGGPGAGKTMLMERELAKSLKAGRKIAYIDPDAVCLKSMNNTYKADVEKDPSKEGRLAAYNKWRPASNGINHLILANLIKDKLAFYFGMTSTGPVTHKFFEFLKKEGYQIHLLHVSAEDDVRFASIQERDKTFIQTTLADTKEKGLLLPQRINDTFLEHADKIDFYWRDGVKEEAKLVATWVRNTEGSDTLGTLEILDNKFYENMKRVHNTAVNFLQRPDLNFEKSVEEKSSILIH